MSSELAIIFEEEGLEECIPIISKNLHINNLSDIIQMIRHIGYDDLCYALDEYIPEKYIHTLKNLIKTFIVSKEVSQSHNYNSSQDEGGSTTRLEEFTATAQTEIDAIKTANGGEGMWMQFEDSRREYTEEEYDIAVTKQGKRKFYAQENDYKMARALSYPQLAEQLDLLYHDMNAGKGDNTGEWYKAIKEVKDDNPKPSE